MERHRKQQFTFSGAYVLVALGALLLFQGIASRQLRPRAVSYTDLLAHVRQGRVERIELGTNTIVAQLRTAPDSAGSPPPARASGSAQSISTSRLPGIEEASLLRATEERGVQVTGRIERPSFLSTLLLSWVLPFVILMGGYVWLMGRMNRRGGPLSIGKSHAKIYDQTQERRVTFDDVAGVEEAEAELVEVVDFLRTPSKYRALGARIPKGVLLVGPPGTGKTLLARAVAGEAGVPFFSLSGSEFVEMFVGVGAARMRSLFEQAKERAPCIVFIDELDAIGKARGGVGALATHDEREQTLNQLLVEMDGFDGEKGVIIMAATNRPEVLDPALLRAGRFDRQVLVDRPDVRGRRAVLAVHVRRLTLAPDVSLETVAQRTPGMAGADLANVVNEAALAAGRRGAAAVEQRDFEEAVDRIQLGLEQRGRVLSPDDRRRVACHEAGHALVALSVEHADPVHRVSIIPRSIGALGVTLQLPEEDRHLLTTAELRDRICVLFGGRAAESVALGDVSTGASNDLERATELARQMVCRFGMSERLGPVALGRSVSPRFLAAPLAVGEERDFSEETARAIDAEVRSVLEAESARAEAILRSARPVLDRVAQALLERETIDRAQLEALAPGAKGPALPASRVTVGSLG